MNLNKIAGIYKLESPSGKVYIGQSIDLQRRINAHRRLENCKNYPLELAIKKYGWENFKVTILVAFSPTDYSKDKLFLNRLEAFFIKEYDCVSSGYNILPAASNYTYTEERKQHLRELNLGKHHSPESIAKIKAYQSNRTPEHRNNIRLSHLGKKLSPEHRAKLGKHLRKKIMQFSKSGEYLATYNSLTEASSICNTLKANISQCCLGKRPSAGGYKWKYI